MKTTRKNIKTKVCSTFVNLPNAFDRSRSYSYPYMAVLFRALKFVKIN